MQRTTALLALGLFLAVPLAGAHAREVEMPQVLTHLPQQLHYADSLTSTRAWQGPGFGSDTPLFRRDLLSAFVGAGISHLSGDGYFDNVGVQQSDVRSLQDLRIDISMGTWVLDWLRLAGRFTLLNRTIDYNNAGSSDAHAFGLGDAQFEAGLTLYEVLRHAMALHLVWKTPTGRSELVEPATAITDSTAPLGTANHELDIGLSYQGRLLRPRMSILGTVYAAYRYRGRGIPTWIQDTPIAWGPLDQKTEDMLVAGFRIDLLTEQDTWPLPYLELDWYHPIEPSNRNLWSATAGLQAHMGQAALRFGVDVPVYGKLVPDPYPRNFLLRQPVIGIAVGGEVLWWF